MISKMYQKSRSKVLLAIVAFVCMTAYSCKETQDSVANGETVVKINLLGVANPTVSNDNAVSKKGKVGQEASQSKQVGTVPFSSSGSFEVTLTTAPQVPVSDESQSSASNRATATTDRSPLDENIKYKVLVYDADGNYITEKLYTNGVGDQDGIALDAGKTYSFIAYSVNSTTLVPAVVDGSKLTEASLKGIDSDLMYFSGKMTLTAGENNLDVILKHQYSQIITRIKMSPNTTGSITSIVTPIINPTHVSANLKLADGSLTYNGLNKSGVNVVFPALGKGLREVTSLPTMLIHPNESAGILKFGSITIDGETKSNIVVPDLKVIPGQRYYLDLEFKTCTQNVEGGSGMNWSFAERKQGGVVGIVADGVFIPNGKALEKTFTAPGADYGFVFDILQLDNSFNMEVNGVKLAKQEIQFQVDATSSRQNIKFADGSSFSGKNTENGATLSSIYGLKGTALAPLVKVVISRTGEVTMFASKKSGGALYPLVLSNGNSFNTFLWDGAKTNVVKVTQLVDGETIIKGAGSGVKKVSCNLVK